MTINQARAHLAAGHTSVDLTRAALKAAEAADGQGSVVFTRLYRDRALAAASLSDARRQAGRPLSPVDGIPISIKDLFDVAGEVTTAGAPALSQEPPAQVNAAVVDRLESAGAVIVGRTNMTQFALSCLGVNPELGTPVSPWRRDERHIAGGSSSGAAASVADGMAIAAIGSDTGGSVRVPAAFCDLVGFKPTANRVSRAGVFALSPSLDSIGPIARSVACCTILNAVLAPVQQRAATIGRPRIGIPSNFLVQALDSEVGVAFERACDRLSKDADLISVALPSLSIAAEIGALGGLSTIEGLRAHTDLFERLGDRCDPRVIDRFRAAARIDQSDYLRMLDLRAQMIAAFSAETDSLDIIAYPSVSIIPPRLGDLGDDNAYYAANARAYRNAGIANLLDGCAISIPCMAPGNAPVGLTLMGQSNGDATLLALAERLEATIRG